MLRETRVWTGKRQLMSANKRYTNVPQPRPIIMDHYAVLKRTKTVSETLGKLQLL